MIAPVLDMPTSTSSATGSSRRPECVQSTPYTKFNEDSRSHFRLSEGFYEVIGSSVTHPLIERQRHERMRRAHQIVDRWNAVAANFAEVPPQIIIPVLTNLITILLNEDFDRVTFGKTSDDSLIVTSEWKDRTVYIDIYFDEDEPDGYEAILNAYYQKKPIISVAGQLRTVVNRFYAEVLGSAVRLPEGISQASL